MPMLFIVLCAAAAVAFLSPATAARAARVNRRDVWVPSNPQAFEVDIGFDQAGRYVITIGMVSRQAGRRPKFRIAHQTLLLGQAFR